MTGKVTIIGGAGRVGVTAAYALQLGRSCSEIVLVDVAAEAAQGEALDLTHGRAAAGGPPIRAGDYAAAADSDIVVITAGLRRKPDESRLDLVARNVALFRGIFGDLTAALSTSRPLLLVVTNPVDILTYLATAELGWPLSRTIGLGTVLDTLRFRSLLAERFDLDPLLLEGLILGEHGDSMVPILSSLHYRGRPITSLPNYSQAAVEEIFQQTRTAGATCLRLKGGAGFAVGLAVRQVVEALLGEGETILPVSTLHQTGPFAGVAFSLPTRVGPSGVVGLSEPELSEDERRALHHSAEVLRKTIAGLSAEGGGQA